jgi:hypothetical protein
MAIKNTNIFHGNAFKKFAQVRTFCLKIYHLATLILSWGNRPRKKVTLVNSLRRTGLRCCASTVLLSERDHLANGNERGKAKRT